MMSWFSVITTALVLLVAANPVSSQQSNEKVRIGFSRQRKRGLYVARVNAFKNELGRRGYVEGQNLDFENRYAGGKSKLLSSLAAELVGLNVNVILTTGSASTRAVKNATSTIPIGMQAGNPVRGGLVAHSFFDI